MSHHIYWEKCPQPATAWMPSQEMHRFHLKLLVARLALLLLTAIGIVVLLDQAGTLQPVEVRTRDGSVAIEFPTRGRANKEAMLKSFSNVVAAAFYRTEKGAAPDLKKYVRDGMLSQLGIAKDFNLANGVFPAGYLQAYRISSATITQATPQLIEVHFKGVFVSRSADRSQADELNIAAAFEPTPKTAAKPLGYELTGLHRFTEK